MPLDDLAHAHATRSALGDGEGGRLRPLPAVLPPRVLPLRDARVGHDVHALVPHLRGAGRDLQALRRVCVALSQYVVSSRASVVGETANEAAVGARKGHDKIGRAHV